MGIEVLTERFSDQIAGVLSCWDRVLIFGTLPKICYVEGMTSYLYAKQVRIFDYPKCSASITFSGRPSLGSTQVAGGGETGALIGQRVEVKEDAGVEVEN